MSCSPDEPQCVPLKRGDTFAYAGTVNLLPGDWSGECTVNDNEGTSVGTITVTLAPPVAPETRYTMVLEQTDTGSWPFGTLKSDIKFTDSSASPAVVIHSPTFYIKIGKYET